MSLYCRTNLNLEFLTTLFIREQQIIFCFQYYIAAANIILQLIVLHSAKHLTLVKQKNKKQKQKIYIKKFS